MTVEKADISFRDPDAAYLKSAGLKSQTGQVLLEFWALELAATRFACLIGTGYASSFGNSHFTSCVCFFDTHAAWWLVLPAGWWKSCFGQADKGLLTIDYLTGNYERRVCTCLSQNGARAIEH